MAKKQKPVFDLMKINPKDMSEDEFEDYGKLLKKEIRKVSTPGASLKDLGMDDRSKTLKSGRPKKKLPPRGSGKYMSQFDKDMNAAKKKGDVKEQTRLNNIKKSKEANIKAAKNKKINEGITKVLKKKSTGPKIGVTTGRRAKRMPRGDITKKMNMGGAIMKNRGGMFKGTY